MMEWRIFRKDENAWQCFDNNTNTSNLQTFSLSQKSVGTRKCKIGCSDMIWILIVLRITEFRFFVFMFSYFYIFAFSSKISAFAFHRGILEQLLLTLKKHSKTLLRSGKVDARYLPCSKNFRGRYSFKFDTLHLSDCLVVPQNHML